MNLQKIYSACLHVLYADMLKKEFSNDSDKEIALNVILSAIQKNEMSDEERDILEAHSN